MSDAKSASSSAAPSVAASSSESSSDEDEESGGLASLIKLQRTPVIKKAPERRQVKMLDLPGNVKNPALERVANRSARDEARRTAMRLKPDISYLHRSLLSWDYDSDSTVPPGAQFQLMHVPDRFENEQHYRRVFEPLLFMECWAAIQASKENNEEKYECQILTRQYSDDWIDLDIAITDSLAKDWMLTDTEIVLLRQPDGKKNYLCKVQNYKTSFRGVNATLRMMAPKDGGGPQINTTWVLSKVYRSVFLECTVCDSISQPFSLTTVHREYAALMALPYYDLCPVILNPRLPEPARVDRDEVTRAMQQYNLNEPQARAILSALNTDGFSLIQG